MLKRLRASLANPSSIPQYKNDNIFLVLLYIVILSFIAALPVLITSVRTNGASASTKYQIRELLVENRDSFLEGNITDNTLTITNEVEGSVLGEKVAIVLPTDDVDISSFITIKVYYVVKLNDHNIEVYFLGNKVKTYTYTVLGLDGLDFSFINETDYKLRTEGFEKIEAAYDKVVNDIKPFWITFDVVKRFFEVFVIAILFDLVCALLIRGLKGISFNEGFVITMYAFAMQSIGQIFDSLYNLDICAYLGAFIGIVYFIIAIRNTNNAKNIDIRE
jgi:hypothetical protein